MFIGREVELKVLKNKYKNDNFELGIIYGQRRIGKTSLILESAKSYKHIYLLSRSTSYQDNLLYFNNEYKKFLNSSLPLNFTSIDEILLSLKELSKNQKLIVIIDELPFLAKVYPGIVSFLQGYTDALKRENINMKLILSGSDVSFMLDLLENKAKPLYQRATFRIHVLPMIFSDAAKMLENIDDFDKVKYLSIFGNRPYYLEKIDKNKSFDENIIELCFSNNSILIDAPNITLPLGYSGNSAYISILTAISNRKHKVKEIADYLQLDSKVLSTYLKRMSDSESVEKRETFNGNHKTNYYEISDPFIRFYYKLIFLNIEDIQRGLGKEIFKSNLKVIDSIIEHGFEDVVNSYMDEKNLNGELNAIYHSFKKYSVDNSILGRSVEIDGLSESLDKRSLLVIEAKYRNKDISLKVLNHLKESASIFSGYKNKVYYLFSKTSFADDLVRHKSENIKLISLADMFTMK